MIKVVLGSLKNLYLVDSAFPPLNNPTQVFISPSPGLASTKRSFAAEIYFYYIHLITIHKIYIINIQIVLSYITIFTCLYAYSVVVVLVQLVVRKITVELNAQLKMVELLKKMSTHGFG